MVDLRALVVDDEQLAREELCFLLDRVGGVEVVGQAAHGADALQLIEALDPDVVFLDVQMPGLTGFQVAHEVVRRGLTPQLVFVTAFDQYAIQAFEVNAVDYLLKPVEPGRLSQAVSRARDRASDGRKVSTPLGDGDLERIVQMVAERQSRRERVAIRAGERFLLIHAEEIIFASVVNDAITIVTAHLAGTSNYRTLDELQSHLDPAAFWRVHRSHLVNINKIKEIVPWFSRNYILKMKDAKATEIPVSRSQTKRLREYLRL